MNPIKFLDTFFAVLAQAINDQRAEGCYLVSKLDDDYGILDNERYCKHEPSQQFIPVSFAYLDDSVFDMIMHYKYWYNNFDGEVSSKLGYSMSVLGKTKFHANLYDVLTQIPVPYKYREMFCGSVNFYDAFIV